MHFTLCYLLPALLLKLPVIRNYGSQGLCLDLRPASSALHALCLVLCNLTCYVQRFPSSKVICSVCLPPYAAFVWRPEWNSISPASVGRVQSRYSTRVIFAAAFHRKLFLVRQLMLRLPAPVISSSILVLTVTTSLHPYLLSLRCSIISVMCNRNLICPEYSLSSHAISGVLLLLEALYTVVLLVVAGYVWRYMSSHVTTSISCHHEQSSPCFTP
jgi:hypothetical protein